MHRGYVYTADRIRGVDVLRLKKGASAEVAAPARSARQTRFLSNRAAQFRPEPGTSGLCLLRTY